MTKPLSGARAAESISEHFPESVIDSKDSTVIVKPELVSDVCSFLKETPGLEFDYLVNLTGVDYFDYLEVVYQLLSYKHNHSLTIKARCYDREEPVLPSVVAIWRGADFQEREIYDLLGIRFEGHPSMKRLFLWEGFQGHPLRKDYL